MTGSVTAWGGSRKGGAGACHSLGLWGGGYVG